MLRFYVSVIHGHAGVVAIFRKTLKNLKSKPNDEEHPSYMDDAILPRKLFRIFFIK